MQTDRARLRRLHRLERVRAITRQSAAHEAAEAESAYARLATLAERTRRMCADLGAGTNPTLGHDLARQMQFSAGLRDLGANTSAQAERARSQADQCQEELAMAERRRSMVAERAERAARELALRLAAPPLGPRRPVGTGLE